MPMERATSLIRDLRGLLGDELDKTTGNVITSFLTQDGIAWSAQAMANALRLSANEILDTAVKTVGPEKAARLFGEYLKTPEMSASYQGGQGTFSRYTLPDDYGWAVGGRFQQDGKSTQWVVSLSETLRHVDGAIAARNPEDAWRAIAWIEGEFIMVTLGGPTLTKDDKFYFRYIQLQPDVIVSGTQDIIMRAQWDRQLLAGARKVLVEFKQ